MHCYFVLAGDATVPILYHVERVREGKSFLTRTVQARQRGKCIFTTTLSFMREGSGGESTVDHGWDLPEGVREGLDEILRGEKDDEDKEAGPMGVEQMGPFISKRLGIANRESLTRAPNVHDVVNQLEKPHRPTHTIENLKPGSPVAVPSLPLVANMLIFPP